MSLLIKALQKAEEEKTSDGSTGASLGELSLEPRHTGKTEASVRVEPELSVEPITNTQQAAAGMFAAKRPVAASPSGNKKLLLIGIVSLLLLLLIGLYVYSYMESLETPPAMPPRPAVSQPQPETPVIQNHVVSEADGAVSTTGPGADAAAETVAAEEAETKPGSAGTNVTPSSANASTPARAAVAEDRKPQARKSEEVVMGDPIAAPDDGALKVTRNPVVVGVHPDLTAAYQAFNNGDDAIAQYHYRRVLQSDIRNTDALLGMAAIASRQGRAPDAAGWYAKVLEVDPRNTIAQAALASGYAQADPIGAESRIKNMLSMKPDAAHLHAALGNVYAERGDWVQAQQAYFQAFHFAPTNADYAFNLAISLDHLGKASLALQYYQQAQALLSQSGSGNIDRAQLEARIQQLQ
jgi:Flp pilus assembly protein TadD